MKTIPTNVITRARFVADDLITVVAVIRDDIGLGHISRELTRNDTGVWQFIGSGIAVNQDELYAIWSVISMLAVRDEVSHTLVRDGD